MIRASKPKRLYERLAESLHEGIQFARGERRLRATVLAAPPPALEGAAVRRLRRRLKLSQSALARTLNVSAKTVQSWEQGRRRPSQAALRLLQVLAERPETIWEVVGLTASGANGRHLNSRR